MHSAGRVPAHDYPVLTFPKYSDRKELMEARMLDLAGLLAKNFIARKDVKAIQRANGEYNPVREAWKRSDIEAHLAKKTTYGHYLLNAEDQCKVFAFDLDLDDPSILKKFNSDLSCYYVKTTPDGLPTDEVVEFDPRSAWLDRGHPGRATMKKQLKTVAHEIMRIAHSQLELPVACTYTGAKGLHVYAFPGLIPAADAREGIAIVLDALSSSHLGAVHLFRGTNFYRFDNQDPVDGQPNITIEVFPKQDSLEGKDLGNLMRLPLGTNLKNPKDPTFFVDMTTELSDIRPIDPMYALTDGALNPWRRQGE